jgi:hypothetical protein
MTSRINPASPIRPYADLIEEMFVRFGGGDGPHLDLHIARALSDEIQRREHYSISVEEILREIALAEEPSAGDYGFSSRLAIRVYRLAVPNRTAWGECFSEFIGKALSVLLLLASIFGVAVGFETPMRTPSGAAASILVLLIGIGGIWVAVYFLLNDF